MSIENVCIFAQNSRPNLIPHMIQSLHPHAKILYEGQTWRRIIVKFGRRLFGAKHTLELHHDPSYYNGMDWPSQCLGMFEFFNQANLNELQSDALLVTVGNFEFAVGGQLKPPLVRSDDDPRFELLCNLAQALDGCVFHNDQLLDASGRVLISPTGEYDPKAVHPSVPENDTEEFDEDELEPEPPSADRVVKRAMVLAAVVGRGFLENQLNSGREEVAVNLPRLAQWLKDTGAEKECESDEWAFINAPAGMPVLQQVINATWRTEGLAVLNWVLGLGELARYDELSNPDGLLESIGFLDPDKAKNLMANAQLISVDSLDKYGIQALAFHWRMRDFTLRGMPVDFTDYARNCWFGSFQLDWADIRDNDLALGGDPIGKAASELVGNCVSAAAERHRAVNWLRGYETLYSLTPTDT